MYHHSSHPQHEHQLGLHPQPHCHSITHFVPSSPSAVSPLRVIRTLSCSKDGSMKIIRLIETSMKSCIYLTSLIRPNHRTNRNRKRCYRTAKVLLSLSFISIVQRIHVLIKAIQSHSTDSTVLDLSPGGEEIVTRRPKRTANPLKSRLESATQSLELLVNSLDDLIYLNHLGFFKIRWVHLFNPVSSLFNLILNLLNYFKSSIEKAELWNLGKSTRALMLETDRIIRQNKRALRSLSNSTLDSPYIQSGMDNIPKEDKEYKGRIPDLSSLEDQIFQDVKLNRLRKSILKDCKDSLDRISWSRIIFVCDGLVSTYDLLELKCVSHGMRTLVEWTSSILDFKLSYCQILKALSAPHHHHDRHEYIPT